MTENEHEIIFLAPPCFGDERYWCEDDAVVDCDCPDGPHPWIRYERALEASQAGAGEGCASLIEQIERAIQRETLNLPLKASNVTVGVLRDCLAALTTPTRIEASHPQEAVAKRYVNYEGHPELGSPNRNHPLQAKRTAPAAPPSEATLKSKLDEAVEKERAAIVGWLRDDAIKTNDDLRRLHANQNLTMSQAVEWENRIALKCGIADAIASGAHLQNMENDNVRSD